MKISRLFLGLILSACTLASTSAIDAATYYVKQGGSNGNGLSWGHAFNNLESALAQVRTVGGTNEIWIAEGTYKPTFINTTLPYLTGTNWSGTTPSFYVPGNTSIYGGFKGNETSLDQRDPCKHPTILDGDILGNDLPSYDRGANNDPNFLLSLPYVASKDDNARHVLTIVTNSNRTEAVTIDSVTIQNGFAGIQTGQNVATSRGGGIYHRYGALTINNVLFTVDDASGDRVRYGGGRGGALYSAFATTVNITNSKIIDCYAQNVSASFEINSGATQFPTYLTTIEIDNLLIQDTLGEGCTAATYHSLLHMKNTTFKNNVSAFACAGLQVVDNLELDQVFTRSSVIEDSHFLDGRGGGCSGIHLFNDGKAKPLYPMIIRNCEFKGNISLTALDELPSPWDSIIGSAAYDADIDSCTFIQNNGANTGAVALIKNWWPSDGYLYTFSPTITVRNSTFCKNKAFMPLIQDCAGALLCSGEVNGEDFRLGMPVQMIVENNTFCGNSAIGNGGAISVIKGATATIKKNCFTKNQSLAGKGDAIYVSQSHVNNVRHDNKFKPLTDDTVIIE